VASLVLVLACASAVSAHVYAIYQGMNIPIRSAATPTSNGVQSTAGPCSGAATYGSNGVTTVIPGQVINLQLKYVTPHPNPPAGNFFSVGMICTSGNPSTLGTDTPLRLWDTTNTNGVTTMPNQVNNAGITPVAIPAQDLTAIPFTFPSKSPAGLSLSAGDHCTISIMDERSWGDCIDVVVGSQPGPIIAGVVTPVVGVGAAAAIFFGRGAIASKLIPAPAAAAPEKRMWRTIYLAFVTMILAIVATAAPNWSIGSGYHSGPWAMCVPGRSCYDPVISGIAAIYAVRVFTLTAVFAGIFTLALPVLAFYGRIDSGQAAKAQMVLFMYMAGASFASMVIWLTILLVGAGIGGALVCDIIVMAFSIIGTMLSYVWMKAIEIAPKETAMISSSGPIISGGVSASVPVSYPSQNKIASPKATSYPAPSRGGFPPSTQQPGKWGDWEEMYDEENSAYYFFNHSNGESLWEPPAGWPHPVRA